MKKPISQLLALSAFTALNFNAALASPSVECPILQQDETAADCPWAGVARSLLLEGQAGHPIGPKFKALLPNLVRQLETDSSHKDWKDLWGQCINFDEFAKGIIIDPTLLKMLSEFFGGSVHERIVHAGMEHTYGYLFSLLKTPFGYKRARWVNVGTNEGFALQGKPLSPTPTEGTLFSNATYFLGRIAFSDSPAELQILKKGESRVATSLRNFPYETLRVKRIVETVELNPQSQDQRKITLRTDLISFSAIPDGQKNSHLLIYSVQDTPLKGIPSTRLITAFPVEPSFIERITQTGLFGENQSIVTRYNAFVEGLTGTPRPGKRELIQTRNLQ